MAAHGHGLAGSGEVRPRRAWLSSVRAFGVHYQANQAKRRGWEGLSGGWPHGANSGEVPSWRRWWKRRMRPYQAPIDTAERWRRWRRTRRSFGQTGRRIFAVASAQGDGEARLATAELLRLRCCARWRRRSGANEMASASGRRVRVQGVASSARTPTACGSTSRRPATGGKHTAVIF